MLPSLCMPGAPAKAFVSIHVLESCFPFVHELTLGCIDCFPLQRGRRWSEHKAMFAAIHCAGASHAEASVILPGLWQRYAKSMLLQNCLWHGGHSQM